MSTLPQFVPDDSQAITQELIAAYEAMTGKTLYPGQVERLLIDLIAYRETLVRTAINDTGRQNLVAFSRAPMLDYLGELVGVARLPAQSARATVRLTFVDPLASALAIPSGFRVETASGIQFQTTAEVIAAAGSTAIDIFVLAVEPGIAGNGYLAGQVNALVDELAVDVASVANLSVTSAGADEESDDRLGAAQREAVRDNGKQTLFTTTARGILERNGVELKVSNNQLNRLIRDRKLNVAAQRQADPVQALRALYPNHTHEVDPSLCLVYYLKGRQHIMRDRDFYKNKLENYAKVKFKVWRYVLYDRASSVIAVWYCESAGENQHNLFDFLMFAWGQQPGRLFHGLCRFLLWDKGSANTSAAIKTLCRALGVQTLEHEAGNARAKGGVEGANNIVETQFESRLRFEPVDSIAQLNAAASAWSNAWNANLIPGQDTRLRRQGLAEPIARFDLWQRIRADQLLLLPPVEVCRAFMTAKEETRKVRPDLSIGFKHPQADRSATYSLRGLDGVCSGDEVGVCAMVFGDCAIQVTVPIYNGEDRIYQVEPERGYDEYGQVLSAAEIGEEYKAMPHTAIEKAASAMSEPRAVLADTAARSVPKSKSSTESNQEESMLLRKQTLFPATRTLFSFDGAFKVQVAIAEHMVFDERLQAAKHLIDECIIDWSQGSRDEIKVLVQSAFQTDKEGKINTGRVLALRRLDIRDEKWQKAMQAIGESLQVVGSKEYVRIYERIGNTDQYQPISLDVAAV